MRLGLDRPFEPRLLVLRRRAERLGMTDGAAVGGHEEILEDRQLEHGRASGLGTDMIGVPEPSPDPATDGPRAIPKSRSRSVPCRPNHAPHPPHRHRVRRRRPGRRRRDRPLRHHRWPRPPRGRLSSCRPTRTCWARRPQSGPALPDRPRRLRRHPAAAPDGRPRRRIAADRRRRRHPRDGHPAPVDQGRRRTTPPGSATASSSWARPTSDTTRSWSPTPCWRTASCSAGT